MRILHVISTLGIGGAEKHLLTLLPALMERGIESRIAYLKGDGALSGEFEETGIGTIGLAMKAPFDPFAIGRIVRIIDDYRPDLVHTHLFKGDVHGLLAARRRGIPVVSTKHADDDYLRRTWVRPGARWVNRREAARIAISGAIARYYATTLGMDPADFRVVPYGIDLSRFEDLPEKAGARRALGLPEDAFIAGTVGRVHPVKGHEILIEASSKVPGLTVVIVGDGPAMPSVRRKAAEGGGDTRLLGMRADIPSILPAFDIFVLPSRKEGLGLVLLEAMAASLPIIATNVGGIPEVLEGGRCGILVPPDDPIELADAIRSLMESDEERGRLAASGRERVEGSYGLERLVSDWVDIYSRVSS